jgi:hypothetical protein
MCIAKFPCACIKRTMSNDDPMNPHSGTTMAGSLISFELLGMLETECGSDTQTSFYLF